MSSEFQVVGSVRVSLQSSSLVSLRRSTPKHLGGGALRVTEQSDDSEMHNEEVIQSGSFIAHKTQEHVSKVV